MELEATTSLFYGFNENIYLDYVKISWSDQERADYFNTVGVTFMDNMKYLINYYIPDEIKKYYLEKEAEDLEPYEIIELYADQNNELLITGFEDKAIFLQ